MASTRHRPAHVPRKRRALLRSARRSQSTPEARRWECMQEEGSPPAASAGRPSRQQHNWELLRPSTPPRRSGHTHQAPARLTPWAQECCSMLLV